jgi:N-acetylglucosamine malate deacetylase 2
MTAQTLMVVLAHPDDESFPIGGTLAKAAATGHRVHLVTATRGEAGIPGKTAAETAVIRETELRRACAELGVEQLTFLDYRDGQLAIIPDRNGRDRLLALMRQTRPDVVVTFGPDGISGHPDHIAVYRWTTAAFDRLQQESPGPRRLYYIAPSAATQQGCGVPPEAEAVGGPVAFIDVGPYLVPKVRAAQQHQSQQPPFNGDPEAEADQMACHELFRLARPRLAANGADPIVDLFATTNRKEREGRSVL